MAAKIICNLARSFKAREIPTRHFDMVERPATWAEAIVTVGGCAIAGATLAICAGVVVG
jgi:hypothetical protein